MKSKVGHFNDGWGSQISFNLNLLKGEESNVCNTLASQ